MSNDDYKINRTELIELIAHMIYIATRDYEDIVNSYKEMTKDIEKLYDYVIERIEALEEKVK